MIVHNIYLRFGAENKSQQVPLQYEPCKKLDKILVLSKSFSGSATGLTGGTFPRYFKILMKNPSSTNLYMFKRYPPTPDIILCLKFYKNCTTAHHTYLS